MERQCGVVVRELHGLDLNLNLALAFISFVSLGKLSYLSVPQFPLSTVKDSNFYYFSCLSCFRHNFPMNWPYFPLKLVCS